MTMVLTSIELDTETYQKVKKSGIPLRKLVHMGLNSIEERRQLNQQIDEYRSGFSRLHTKISTLNGRLLALEMEKEQKNDKING